MELPTTRARRARWAVTTVFCINGMLIASLAVRTPSLQLDLGLTAGQLGLSSAVFGVFAVAAMQVAGGLAARFGSAQVVRLTVLLGPLGLIGVGLAGDFRQLAVALLVLGAIHGTLDVAMNAHAVAVERTLRRHIMNGCHGAWSIGAVAGSLLGSGAAHLDISRALHYALFAALAVPLGATAGTALLPADVDRAMIKESERHGRRSGWRAGWTRRVLLFGAMGATVLTCEAAVANWSGVFLHEQLGASLGLAGLGYVAFTGCQTLGRLVGDRLQALTSAVRLVRLGTLAAAAGLAVSLLSSSQVFGVIGFAVMGLGLATPLPVLFGVVGHLGAGGVDGRRSGAALALARFTTMTYAGILLAPAAIGGVADLVGLTWTLAGLVPLLAAVAGVAPRAIGPTGVSIPGTADRRAGEEPA
jgi:MFS family permease